MPKICCTCHKRKKLSQFHKCKKNKSGRQGNCIECDRIHFISWTYGVTKKEAKKLFKETKNGHCIICGVSAKECLKKQRKSLCIDHDHITGKIRGIICSNCNKALGHVQDDPEILFKMIDYLS